MKCYVYALDIKRVKITATLSFPNENTAEQAYLSASREMEEVSMGAFQFGYTSDSQVTDSFGVELLGADLELEIGFTSLPMYGYPGGVERHRVFGIDEFEFAAVQTKKILSDSKYSKQDIQFMRHVRLAMTNDVASDIPSKVDVAACLRKIQVTSGKKKQKSSLEPCQEQEKSTAVNISGLNPAAQNEMRQVFYEAGLALKHAGEVDEWHHISMTKYQGKGWADIAKAVLEQRREKSGKKEWFYSETGLMQTRASTRLRSSEFPRWRALWTNWKNPT